MTSNRVYRSALSVEQAKQELRKGSGSQFHPQAAAAMLALLEADADVRQLVKDAPEDRQPTSWLAPMNISDVADLRVMQRIAREIGTLTEIDTFLEHVHTIVREELNLADVVIWLFNDNSKFELFAGEIDLPAPERLIPSTVKVEGMHSDLDTMIILGRDLPGSESEETVIFPMYVEDSLIGLIELVLFAPGQVAGRDVDLLHAIAAPIASTVRVAQLHDSVKRAAMTDGLTGVLNHRAFYQRLDAVVSTLKGDEAIHLLIVDVIGLKAINDNYGHLIGDRVLKTVADAFVKRLRAADVVARYGGDEFAAILRGKLDMPLQEIVALIEAPVPCEVAPGVTLNVRLRCGSAQSVDGDTRATELVARADALMYERVRPSVRIVAD
jgi:diguanylate cyclase (GGDEF)-like protein